MPEHSKLPPISANARFTPRDFQEVLRHLPKNCPLVGGQAVAWWAERYGIKVQYKGKEQVVTSRDIDFWGGRDDLIDLAKRLKRRAVFPNQYEMTVWVGAVALEIAGLQTMAEFLHTIPGLDTNNPDSACVEQDIEIGGLQRRIQILTPVSLVLVKLHALRHFDQKERQDEFHLLVTIEAARHFITELLTVNQVRLALWNSKRLVECQQFKATRKLEKEYGFEALRAVPVERIQVEAQSAKQSAEDQAKLSRFCTSYWPRVIEKCRQRT